MEKVKRVKQGIIPKILDALDLLVQLVCRVLSLVICELFGWKFAVELFYGTFALATAVVALILWKVMDLGDPYFWTIIAAALLMLVGAFTLPRRRKKEQRNSA